MKHAMLAVGVADKASSASPPWRRSITPGTGRMVGENHVIRRLDIRDTSKEALQRQ